MFPEYRDRSLLDVFRELAATCPNRTAVSDGEHSLSYQELHDRIEAVATGVTQQRGASDGEPWVVTAIVGHGIDALLTVYGVMAAGAVLVPLDAAEPVERIAQLHRTGGAELTVSTAAHVDLVQHADGRVVLLDDLTQTAGSLTHDGPEPGALAMVNFTSGSTGTPKGVVRDHVTLVRSAFTTAHSTLIESDDRVGFAGSFSFIGAYRVSLGAFVAGAELALHDPRAGGARALAEWVLDRQISVLNFIPAALRNFSDVVAKAGLPRMDAVKIVSLGGEATYRRDIARARELFGPATRFVSRYGSSETGVAAEWVMTAVEDGSADEPLPLGRPLPWAEITVVDDAGEPLADGEIGMSTIVSEHCSLGYWNDPELTAAKFWSLPDGRRGFRASDRVRLRPDGVLEYVARADDRVKVRGVMVSPSEVEHTLTTLHGIADAAVVPAAARDGGTALIGYVVPDGDTTLSPRDVRRTLATRVPTAMVPSTIVVLESLPLNARGKVDRGALPSAPNVELPPYRKPVGLQALLADIFAEVLDVDDVGLDDDFFALGGDSLAVVELLAGIADQFAVDVPASTVLEAPTVAELFLRLTHRRPRDASPVVVLRTDAREPGLFCVTGGGGPAISLRNLSDAMGDRNFAALQPRGLEERAVPDHRVTAAARRNVTAMRELQPHGPYAIAGYSSGSTIAFEMACLLRAAGEEVACLVILDRDAPGGGPTLRGRARRRTAELHTSAPEAAISRTAVVAGRITRAAVTSAYAHARRRAAFISAGWLPRRGYHQYRLFFRLNIQMARKYVPSSIFDGPTLVVRGQASDGLPPDDGSSISLQRALADLGWSQFVSGPITVVEVPGDHSGLLRKPVVDLVAAHINTALDHATITRPDLPATETSS